MNREFFVHGEIAKGVILLACVYCLRRPLYRGGLKFKVCMCVCVCVCRQAGKLIIFCTAKDDLVWPNLIHRAGCRGGGGQVQSGSKGRKKLTIHFYLFIVPFYKFEFQMSVF